MRRYSSITWLKCIACILITNSHMEKLYPANLGMLSFGGMFGNCLFFLISGFCLLHIKDNFPGFCIKRIIRIYIPYLLFILFYGRIGNWEFTEVLLPIRHYHFIACIITLYPIYYISAYLNKIKVFRLECTFIIAVMAQIIYYFGVYDFSYSIYMDYKFLAMSAYFQMMLLGGILNQIQSERIKRIPYLITMILSFAFYGYSSIVPLQGYLSILTLWDAVIFVWSTGKLLLSFEDVINDKLAVYTPKIQFIADLTLEIYIVQFVIISSYEKVHFPVGFIMALISIVAVASCLKKVSDWVTMGLYRLENSMVTCFKTKKN